MSFSEKSSLMDILLIDIFLHIDLLIHGCDSLIGSILECEDIMEDLMTLDPEDLWYREYFLEDPKHSGNTSCRIRFDHICEGVVNGTFYVRLSDSLIGCRETGSHEQLTKVRIERGHMRDIFLIEDECYPMCFSDYFDRLFE